MSLASVLARSLPPRTMRLAVLGLLVTVLVLSLQQAGAYAEGAATPKQVAKQVAKHGAKHGSKHGTRGGRTQRREAVRGTLASLPPVVQPGTSPAAPSDKGALVATFTPADPGRKVTLERQTARGWKAVDTSTEDAWGSAAFAPGPGIYRARTTLGGRTWVTGNVRQDRWEPRFEDTFSGTTLDTTVWNDQKREHESVYAPRTCARVDPAARRVADGVLHLGVALDPVLAGTPCDYTSTRGSGTSPYLLNSQVSTEYTRFFRHGIVAARIKPQRAKGMHSGLWLLPAGTKYTDGVPSAGTEIDVMEFFGENGRDNEAIGSHVHYYEADWQKVTHGDLFADTRLALGKGRSWWDEFHVFSVEWTPTEYVFRVDGREYYRETDAVSQADQYLVLSDLTSDYELGDLTADELDDTAQVDWIRVFDASAEESVRVTRGRSVARTSRS